MDLGSRLCLLLGTNCPVIQAPMVGSGAPLASAVCQAGALGSLACGALNPSQVRQEVSSIRRTTARPFNLNFFCHAEVPSDLQREAAWRARLYPYYVELGLDTSLPTALTLRRTFDEGMCAVIEELRPAVVSFHFGLPDERLLARVRNAGCLVLASATTVREALWLADRQVDAIIAQGAEAGGHRGMFLTDDVSCQVGTLALVPQVVDSVSVPVVAAGGIADERGVAAAFALGASGVQVGTAYLKCPEAGISPLYLAALVAASEADTALTNVFTGRPARGLLNRALRELGPISAEAPAFPHAVGGLQPLRTKAEREGSVDFSPMWCGQAAALCHVTSATELTRKLARGWNSPRLPTGAY